MKLRHLVVAALATVLVTACKNAPKKTDGTEGGEASQTNQTPDIVEKPIGIDAAGSDGGKIEGLFTVTFEYDQARLSSDARQKLEQNATWIKGHPGVTVQIEGHTDSRGTVEYNLALGERRAKSVKTYLQGLGVDSKRLTVISYGEEKPLDTADNETAWSKNRRANFVPLNQ